MKNLTYILPLVLTLSACGGGGGGGGGNDGGSGGGNAASPGTTPPVTSTPGTTPPTTDTPSTGTPSTGTPSTGTPSTGTPSTGTPSTGTPSTGTPSTGDPSTGTPSTGTPSTGNPSTGTPSTGTPSTGDPSTGTPTTPTTPTALDKYVGTHLSECVVGSRQRATFARAGNDSLTFALSLDLYANASCTGAVIGTVSFSAPATLTYTDTRTATLYWLPSGGASSTQTVTTALDHFMVSAPATRTVVTGSGVTVGTVNGHREACIAFNYTNPLCKNIDEWIPAYTVQQGLALTGTTLYVGNAPDASQPAPYNTWYRVNVLYTKQ